MPALLVTVSLLAFALHLPFDQAVALQQNHGLRAWAHRLPPEIRGIVVDLKTLEGRVGVPFDHPLAARTGAYNPAWDLRSVVETLHHLGFRVIARVAVLRDSLLYLQVPSPYVQWFTPQNAVALAYNRAVLQAIARLPVDEIQLDYIRWPDTRKPKTPEQRRWRRQTLRTFVRHLLQGLPDSLTLSADLFGRVCFLLPDQADVIGQHPLDFLDLVEILSPMMYPSHYWGALKDPYQAVFQSSVALQALGVPPERIRPWLQAFPMRLPDTVNLGAYLTRQLQALLDTGLQEAMFWLPNLQAVRQALAAIPPPDPGPWQSLDLTVQTLLDPPDSPGDSGVRESWARGLRWIRYPSGAVLYWHGVLCRVWRASEKGSLPVQQGALLTDPSGIWGFLWTSGEPRSVLQALWWPGGDARSHQRMHAWILQGSAAPPGSVRVRQDQRQRMPEDLQVITPLGNSPGMPHTQTQQEPGGKPE